MIVGGYDDIRSLPSFPGWDFVLLTDREPSLWKKPLSRSRWQVRLFDNPGLDLTRYSRLPKLKPHLFFPDYDYSVYIDGNARLERNPTELLELLGWPEFAVSEHPFRNNLYDEFSECRRMEYDAPDVFDKQEKKYRLAGLADPAPLYENNFILRRHNNPKIKNLDDYWFEELSKESKRDQLSLPFACWKLNYLPSTFSQKVKTQYFRTSAHYRSLWTRLARSIQKRTKKLSFQTALK